MPILLLLRLILETSVTDIQTAEMLEKFKKNSDLFAKFMRNPAVFLKSRAMAKVLGKGKKQDELNAFQEAWKSLANLPVIKKKIMNHLRIKNFAKIQQIQKHYLKGLKIMNSDEEAETSNYDEMIGVYVNLSSSALAGGLWTPVIQQQSGTYGIASITYVTNLSKSYDYFMVTKETWIDMCEAKGMYGSGANSVFMREYYHGGLKKPQREERARTNVQRMHEKVTKPSKSVIGVVNKTKAMKGYSRYKNYGRK